MATLNLLQDILKHKKAINYVGTVSVARIHAVKYLLDLFTYSAQKVVV